MKAICLALALFSTAAFADQRGFKTGEFSCVSDPSAWSWKISDSGIAGLPLVEYTAIINGEQDNTVRGIATIEEVRGGTIVGVRGFRGGAGKFTIFFGLDGNIHSGMVNCVKK